MEKILISVSTNRIVDTGQCLHYNKNIWPRNHFELFMRMKNVTSAIFAVLLDMKAK